jgi:FkbM family methyltransferase
MRCLWVSNGRMWKTGYGNQTDLVVPRLKTAGYDPVIFAFTDRLGAVGVDKDGIITLYQRYDNMGNDVYGAHMEWSKAEFSFGLFDFFAVKPEIYAHYPHWQWVPVDCSPLRPDLNANLRMGARGVLAMSKFGEGVLRKAGYDPIYVPHGVDGKTYHPIDRIDARARLQKRIDEDEPEIGYKVDLGDKFIVLMNSANVFGRKGFYEGLSAFAQFHTDHPASVLYLHTEITGARGENIDQYLKDLAIPQDAVVWPNQYFYGQGMLDGEWMNDLYNAADVLLQPSYGEGFGIPLIEAQMAGCPVIATNCSAMTELVLSGYLVGGSSKFPYVTGAYYTRPDIRELIKALSMSLHTQWDREQVSAKAQRYDIETVMSTYMLPAFETITQGVRDWQPITLAAKNTSGHTHRWAQTGLFIRGVLNVPCLEGACDCALQPGGRIVSGVYPSKIGDIDLDIEDDPIGGVSKIIMREAIDTYHLDKVSLKPGDVVLDIGAHVGIISIYLAKRFCDLAIHAFEPHPDNFKRLERNIEANCVESDVMAINQAMTHDGRFVGLPPIDGNSGGQNIYSGFNALRRAESTTLEHWIKESHTPALIKMDCEGAEYEILEGNTHLLAGVKYFVGEFHVNREFSQARATALQVAIAEHVEHVYIGFGPMSEVEHAHA